MKDGDTENFLQSGPLCAADRNSSIVRDVHSFTLSIQLLFWLPRRRPPSSMPSRTVLHRESCRVTCPNQANFRRLTLASSAKS
ncbi:hypothetical protein DPMN_066646 [Dreissena polymorpha]|uniref:Uncharacterized protein n=1 Tax=Dreissena polymorpha TaxID=45954 RepID=A0A9D3YYU6_DREPO|nr:hypothetical protein DPMN_066646 [Dreissena polymorpha]